MLEEHYEPQTIERQAQQFWEENQSFNVTEDLSKEKFYCLSMFPYPSGQLHMGHVRNYTIGDVISRYQRMIGKNVLQPIGWDAFGLPAENAAIKQNVAPAKWTYENIDAIRTQFKRLGCAYDWKRELTTCKPEYYRWEQWLFVKLFEKGLAYKKNAIVNWDPVDKTVLANEQVVDGRGWRSGALVERREIPQWFLKITDYADELLDDLDKLEDWPEQVRTMQKNWIGRSEGVEIYFDVSDAEPLEAFTTRPDTLMGVTYIAIAPQHPLALKQAENNPELKTFIEECSHIQVAEAALATLEKKGVNLGMTAKHPISGEDLPIWVANFVVMEYGTGVVMSVPAHDQRDYEFAHKYNLPIKQVIKATDDDSKCDLNSTAFTENGTLINSGEFDGSTSEQAFSAITDYLQRHKRGQKKIHYRLRDWGVSRQRYWGTPIPIINCPSCGAVPVPESALPVILPEDVHFDGTTSPLKDMPEFYQTTCPNCHETATRETNTFDTFVESSWYFARYACVNQQKMMLDARAKYWMPVDHYIGGVEHAVMHLLYARFINKVLRDEGLLNNDEPFNRLLTQGMVLKNGAKMSKSKGNVVEPTTLIDKYGADTARLFTMFASSPEQTLEWSDSGVEGAYRFLKRIWAFATSNSGKLIKTVNKIQQSDFPLDVDLSTTPQTLKDMRREVYEHLQQADYDFKRQQFNTVVSASMKIFNLLAKLTSEQTESSQENQSKHEQALIHEGFSILLRLLSPIAPHITHHLWRELAYGDDILNAKWPKVKTEALQIDTIDLVAQINGKLRGKLSIPADADQKTIEQMALANESIQRFIANKTVKKIIVVPKKLVNIVVG